MARNTRSVTRPAAKRAAPAGSPPAAAAREEDLMRLVAGLLAEHDLTEFEIQRGELRIRAARTAPAQTVHLAPAAIAAPTTAAPVPAAAAPGKSARELAEERKPVAEHPGTVKSPMVGTAYLRPNPESNAFVEIGARVSVGDKLLLIEAMKTFNDIVAHKAGVITAMLVEDGQPVEYGQPLLIIE
jgi:acetyl-CoA carboxylase biotin carboxyl carrier protein